MIILFFMLGIIVGVSSTLIFKRRNTITGTIRVDHINGEVRVLLNTDELINKKHSTAVLNIDHDAHFSR